MGRDRILIFGAADHLSGKVMINGDDKRVRIIKYEGKDDVAGIRLKEIGCPIDLFMDQKLKITRKKGRITNEVIVFVGKNEGGNRESDSPQGVQGEREFVFA